MESAGRAEANTCFSDIDKHSDNYSSSSQQEER